MRSLIGSLVLFFSLSLFAQPTHLGETLPLTNTRYAGSDGAWTTVSNGTREFVFWYAYDQIRVTPLTADRHLGRPILGANGEAAVVWTGQRFIVVAPQGGMLIGRALDGRAQPLGEPYAIAPGFSPRLAFNGSSLLLVYDEWQGATFDTRAIALTAGGTAAGASRFIAPRAASAVVATNNRFVILTPESGDNLQETEVDNSGAILTTRSFSAGGLASGIVMKPGGTGYAAMWTTSSGLNLATFGTTDTSMLLGISGAKPAIGRKGADLLAAWIEDEHRLRSSVIRANGTIEAPTTIAETTGATKITGCAVDDGAIAYVAGNELRVTNSEVVLEANGITHGDLIAQRSVFLGSDGQAVMMRDLTNANDHGEALLFRAAWQDLAATATTANGTLFLWTEGKRLYSGIRDRDGGWTEQQISDVDSRAWVATDGNGFMVLGYNDETAMLHAMRLDDRGRVRTRGAFFHGSNPSIVWNGSTYVAVYDNTIAKIDASCNFTNNITLQPGANYSLGSDGNGGVLLAWDLLTATFPPAFQRVVDVVRLDANLDEIGSRLQLDDLGAYPEVAWDGENYTVVWQNETGGRWQKVSPQGAAVGPRRDFTAEIAVNGRAFQPARVGHDIAITWPSHDRDHLAFLGDDELEGISSSSPGYARVAILPDGRAAYVDHAFVTGAPHHAIRRIDLRLLDEVTPPAPPDAPEIHAQWHNGRVAVDWTRPEQAVSGYRVEYRVGDGTWNELERWFDPDTRSFSITPPREGVAFAVRVRAWGDGGTSAYSEPAGVTLRRRSVR